MPALIVDALDGLYHVFEPDIEAMTTISSLWSGSPRLCDERPVMREVHVAHVDLALLDGTDEPVAINLRAPASCAGIAWRYSGWVMFCVTLMPRVRDGAN